MYNPQHAPPEPPPIPFDLSAVYVRDLPSPMPPPAGPINPESIGGPAMDWGHMLTSGVTVDDAKMTEIVAGLTKVGYGGVERQLDDVFGAGSTAGTTVIDAMAHSRIIVLRGQTNAGKSTLMPLIAARCAEAARKEFKKTSRSRYRRDFIPTDKDPDGHHTLFEDAKYSYKFVIVAKTAQSAKTLSDRFHKMDCGLVVNHYLSIGGNETVEQMDRSRGGLENLESSAFNHRFNNYTHGSIVTGIIVDGWTAETMVRTGSYIGSIFVENCEQYDQMPYLTPLISAAASRMYSLHPGVVGQVMNHETLFSIGRMFLLTTDEPSKTDWLMDTLKPMVEAPLSLIIIQYTVRPLRSTPDDFMFTCVPTFTSHLEKPGDRQRMINNGHNLHTHKTTNDAKAKLLTKFMIPRQSNDTELVMKERLTFDKIHTNADERIASTYPDMENNRKELEGVLHEVLRHTLVSANLDNNPEGPSPNPNITLPTILLVASSKEQVNAIGASMKSYPEFHLQSPLFRQAGRMLGLDGKEGQDWDSAFMVSKLQFGWKYDVDINRRNRETLAISDTVYRNKKEGRCLKGRFIVATFDVAETLELDKLAAIILSCSVTTKSEYVSNGLFEPRREFIDGPMIRSMMSRFGRHDRPAPDRPKLFIFAGSTLQASRCYSMDNRTLRHDRAYSMREFLLEHCSSHPLRIARHNPPLAIADNMKEDAKILGLVEDSHTFLGQTETTGETGLLLGILPHVDIRFKRMLVLAVRMGVALQAAAIVADDMTNGRLLQQANSTNPTAADGRIGYGYPFVDIFKEAVPLLPLGNHGIPNIGKYPSMILAMSDALGCFTKSTRFSKNSEEFESRQFTAPPDPTDPTLIYQTIPNNNFWRCAFASPSVPGFNGNPAFDCIRSGMAHYGRGATGALLYTMMIKDEGRAAFHQALHEINDALIAIGLIDPNGCLTDAQYNRYTIEDSDMLNDDGRSLLSGLLAMCLSDIGKAGFPITKKNEKGEMVPRPTQYWVFHGLTDRGRPVEHCVTGYSIAPKTYDYAMYPPTEHKRNSDRYHANIHEVSAGHIIFLANIFGPVDHSFQADGQSIFTVRLTGAPKQGKMMRFKIDGLPNAQLDVVESTRHFLKDGLTQALANKPVGEYEKKIIKIWNLFR